MEFRTERKVLLLLAAGFCAVLTGCRDSDQRGLTEPPNAASADVLYTSYSEFDQVSADITVASEGGYPGFERSDAFRGQSYQVERNLQAATGVWATNLTLSQVNPFGVAPPPNVRFIDVARIETDDVGSFLRVYDRAGNLVTDPVPPEGTSPPNQGVAYLPAGQSPFPPLDPVASSQPPRSLAGPPDAITGSRSSSEVPGQSRQASRAWLDRMVITPASRARTLQRLAREFGPPRERAGQFDRYSRQRGARLVEVLVDAGTGAIVEENYALDGNLQAHIRHEYSPGEAGLLVLSRTHAETVSPRPRVHRTVITTTISNVKVRRIAP